MLDTSNASWDVKSRLHWLGNNNVFFLRYCGTSCQGVALLSLESNQTIYATLSYTSFPDQPEKTHFRDWFGQEFNFDGLVSNLSSETEDNSHYLVFMLEDYDGNSLGEKRLLFVDNSLKLVFESRNTGLIAKDLLVKIFSICEK